MLVKAWNRNKTGEVTAPLYSEKITLKLPDELNIMFLLSTQMLFYPLLFNFCNSEINHLLCAMFCIALVFLAQVCEHSVLLNFIWNYLLIVRVILWEFSEKKRQVNTGIIFLLLNIKTLFYIKLKKQKICNYITLQCSLGSHGDHSTKFSSNNKCCDNGQWSLTTLYFKPCSFRICKICFKFVLNFLYIHLKLASHFLHACFKFASIFLFFEFASN